MSQSPIAIRSAIHRMMHRQDSTPLLGQVSVPTLVVTGEEDELIPVQALFMGSKELASLEVPVEWHISPGVGHGIDGEGLRHGGEFLARRFGLRV